MKHIWIREEYKHNERRVAIVPKHAAVLLGLGFEITIEDYSLRAFSIEQYKNVGCKIVKPGTWKRAPKDAYILGIKELPFDYEPISGIHMYFSHSFKDQPGAKELLIRFMKGKGYLYDLEYLTDKQGKRIASFGYYAGICALAIALEMWCKIKLNKKNHTLDNIYYSSFDSLLANLTAWLQKAAIYPRILIVGANGRCGQGTNSLVKNLDMSCTNLGREETQDIDYATSVLAKHDIIINCVSTNHDNKQPLVSYETIKLLQDNTIIFDLTCEPYATHNPIEIYSKVTTFSDPFKEIILDNKTIYLSAIDHVPSYLPKESSNLFSSQLMLLFTSCNKRIWDNAETAFFKSIGNVV